MFNYLFTFFVFLATSFLDIEKLFGTFRYSKAELLKFDTHGSSIICLPTDDYIAAYKLTEENNVDQQKTSLLLSKKSFTDTKDHDYLVNRYLYDSDGKLYESRNITLLNCMKPCWKCKHNFLTVNNGPPPPLLYIPFEKKTAYDIKQEFESPNSNENVPEVVRYSKVELIKLYVNDRLDRHDSEVNQFQYVSKKVLNEERIKLLHNMMHPCWRCLNNFLTEKEICTVPYQTNESQLPLESNEILIREPVVFPFEKVVESVNLKENITKTVRYEKVELIKLYVHEYTDRCNSKLNRFHCDFKGKLNKERKILLSILRPCRQCEHNFSAIKIYNNKTFATQNLTLQHAEIEDKIIVGPVPIPQSKYKIVPTAADITTVNEFKVDQNTNIEPVKYFDFNLPTSKSVVDVNRPEINSTRSIDASQVSQHGGAIRKQTSSNTNCVKIMSKDHTETMKCFNLNVPMTKPVVSFNMPVPTSNRSIYASQVSQRVTSQGICIELTNYGYLSENIENGEDVIPKISNTKKQSCNIA